MTAEQEELKHFMRRLSEQHWCAGWLTDLEFILWESILGLRDNGFEDYELNHAITLARKAGGWFCWCSIPFTDSDGNECAMGETFISMFDWMQKFDDWYVRQVLKDSNNGKL